jgi:predicted transcriptional regulator
MNIEKSVFGKLTKKIELESQKFEFGIIEDFSKSEQNMKTAALALVDAASKGDDIQNQIAKLQADYTKQIGLVKKLYAAADKEDSNTSKLFDKAKQAAAGVGISIEEIKGYQSWWAANMALQKAIDAGDKYLAM